MHTPYIFMRAGSPPLARGTGQKIAIAAAGHGITPACAGNSTVSWRDFFFNRDHPRLRGEQVKDWWLAVRVMGSPPLARGTVTLDAAKMHLRRITPACAGNSGQPYRRTGISQDHPRLRGEQRVDMPSVFSSWGSPPLARGTVAIQIFIYRQCGITPACAGNSCA